LLGAFLLPAESLHSLLPEPGRFKISDGLLPHWNVNATDPNRDAIEAFDRYDARVFGVNIYQLLPSAKNVSIYDAAVRRGQSIAIAAVSREKDGRTLAWLLRLGWDGHLACKTQLDAANEIGWLDFDEAGNIWGLTDYLGEKVRKNTIFDGTPGPLGPLILVFNPEGKIVKSILKQADFPDSLREESNIGQVSFGQFSFEIHGQGGGTRASMPAIDCASYGQSKGIMLSFLCNDQWRVRKQIGGLTGNARPHDPQDPTGPGAPARIWHRSPS
jgi:hypothetical protein